MKRAFQALVALLLAALVAAPAQAMATVTHPPKKVSEQDRQFLQQAAQAGLFEIKKSKLALERSDNRHVRAFAKRMIADHSAQAEQLAALAGKLGVPLPDKVNPKQAKLLKMLRGVPDGKFDRAFMRVQVAAHHEAIALFAAEAERGRHPTVRKFAAKSLPVLKDHLRHALKVLEHVS